MLLLDTHTFIWLCMARELLPSKLLKLMNEEADGLFISSITGVEIGLLVNGKNVSVPGSLEKFMHENLAGLGIHEVPVDVDIAMASTQLPQIHSDPFDRIIIATALTHGMTILTKDRMIPTYPKVKAVWE
jgi:PIN domain nuclease of toxin-antitoxin system